MEKLAKLIYFSIFIALIYFTFPLFLPFIFALIMVVLLEPLVKFFIHKLKFKRILAVISIYTVLFASLFVSIYFITVRVIKECIDLFTKLPSKFESFISSNEKLVSFYNDIFSNNKGYIVETANSLVARLNEILSTLAGNLLNVITQFPGYFVAFIFFMVSVYLIGLDFPILKKKFLRFFDGENTKQSIEIVLNKLKIAIVGFLRAQIILSSLVFLITAFVLELFDFKYVLFSAFIVVLIDLLPILGAGSALVPWAIYVFFTGEINKVIVLLLLFLILTVLRRVLEPKLLADSLGLSALSTLISMYLGLTLVGFIGMVIFPVILIVIKTLDEVGIIQFKIRFNPKREKK